MVLRENARRSESAGASVSRFGPPNGIAVADSSVYTAEGISIPVACGLNFGRCSRGTSLRLNFDRLTPLRFCIFLHFSNSARLPGKAGGLPLSMIFQRLRECCPDVETRR